MAIQHLLREAEGSAAGLRLLLLSWCHVALLASLATIGGCDGAADSVTETASVAHNEGQQTPASNGSVASLVMPLARRLAAEPNDPSGWALLGKSYDYLGKHRLSAAAYRKAIFYGNTDPGIISAADAAEQRMASAVFDSQTDTRKAARLTVRGQVNVSELLRDRVRPDQTIFVYAKSVGGPPAPLAVIRGEAAVLPLTFELDDTMAMMPGHNLSSAKQVIIVARISSSGNANTELGDLIGQSEPFNPDSGEAVSVVIDRIVLHRD